MKKFILLALLPLVISCQPAEENEDERSGSSLDQVNLTSNDGKLLFSTDDKSIETNTFEWSGDSQTDTAEVIMVLPRFQDDQGKAYNIMTLGSVATTGHRCRLAGNPTAEVWVIEQLNTGRITGRYRLTSKGNIYFDHDNFNYSVQVILNNSRRCDGITSEIVFRVSAIFS